MGKDAPYVTDTCIQTKFRINEFVLNMYIIVYFFILSFKDEFSCHSATSPPIPAPKTIHLDQINHVYNTLTEMKKYTNFVHMSYQ